MSDERKTQETQQPEPPSVPPAYPTPTTTSTLKSETYQKTVPAATVGRQYEEQLFAACARGQHERVTMYGTCGIITAICLFPFGLICLFADTEHRCARCGVHLI